MILSEVDTADLFFLFATILGALAALLYALGARPVRTDGGRVVSVGVWAPVCLSLAVACASLALMVL
jgi:hypothetical protein